jgi:hypothetical protein
LKPNSKKGEACGLFLREFPEQWVRIMNYQPGTKKLVRLLSGIQAVFETILMQTEWIIPRHNQK